MPRFVLETQLTSPAVRERVIRLANVRFPEVAIEYCGRVPGDERGDRWVCRATSEAHVRRWARAADLELAALRPMGADRS